jgi:hypothetical protein
MIRSGLAAALTLAAGAALAAGGHHAVDDAAILDEQRCEAEGWWGHARAGERVWHAGAACRVGPLELGIAAERTREAGDSAMAWGLQAKWAGEIAPGLSVGFAVAPGWQAHARPRYQGFTVAGLLTWIPAEPFAVHLNLGRDVAYRGDDASRSGVALEWTPRAGWTVLAERYVEDRSHFLRGGLRRAWGDGWSVDASRAHRLRGSGASSWTVGLTREFGR